MLYCACINCVICNVHFVYMWCMLSCTAVLYAAQFFSCIPRLGLALQFTPAMLTGCWVAQLTYMVILLYFPFFGERTLKKKKNIYHAISLVVIITLSLIGPVVALVWFPYITSRFPPVVCGSSNQDWVFYSSGLPLSIGAAIGSILCLLLIRAIHKVSYS